MNLPPGNKWLRRLLAIAAAAIAGTALLYEFLFPLPSPPPLPGPHAVGTLTFEIPAAGDEPPLIAQVWYPTEDASGGASTPWLPDPALAPRFPYQRISSARSRARSGVGIPNEIWPLLFYEHSWTGHRAENVAQVENLASRGFVVVALDHPGQAARVRFADGHVVASQLPDHPDLSSETAVASFLKLADACLERRLTNIARIKTALKDGVAPPLSGHLNFERMGVFGFSFGGTCALRLCARDPAFVAGANEDGLFLFDDDPRGPFLFFDQETPTWLLESPSPDENAGQTLTRKAEARIQQALRMPARYRHVIEGANHASFCDQLFHSRIPRLARAGKRPAAEVHATITDALADFFGRAFR